MQRGRYYLGRVIKRGLLDQEKLIDAILESAVVSVRNYTWTITDAISGELAGKPYVFGKLAKYYLQGHVTVVDSERRSQIDALTPNLLQASSPFIYLPEYSGIAYLHVWNGIKEGVFRRRFQAIIEATYENFVVGCMVEPITNYRTFEARVSKLERFYEISANIHPPNPLFGRICANLTEYMRERNADEVAIRETNEGERGIQSNIIEIIQGILNDPEYSPEEVPAITDAALLMAADGYGSGKVIGEEAENRITIRTGDNQKSFLFAKDPPPGELAREAKNILNRINIERGMGHGEESQ